MGFCIIDAMDIASNILIVDDDREIRTLLADYLEANGFRALMAADGSAMWHMLEKQPVDLIVLDLGLPGEDGLQLCRRLRTTSQTPVVMLTARGEPLDRILGLEMGADDYMVKPFEPRELLARIRNVLRRRMSSSSGDSRDAQRICFSNWTLDLVARHLLNPHGTAVMLSGAEFRLLKIFLQHPNRILSRDQLSILTKGRDADPLDRSIDLQVSRLRQKLEDDAKNPALLKTVRNEGYVLASTIQMES
jgi:two-component system OmpR family response regulator